MKKLMSVRAVVIMVMAISGIAFAGEVVIKGSTTVLPIAQAAAEKYMEANSDCKITVSGGRSGNGIKAIIDRSTDIADASHKLQTPLTTIRVAAEYLLDELREHEEASKYLSTIIEQQERMTKLMDDDLLLLSRIESQLPGKDWDRVDLSPMVNSLVKDISRHPFAEEIEIQSDIQ